MTIHQRGEESAIDKTGDGGVLGKRLVGGHGLLAVPPGFKMVPRHIFRAAAIAPGKIIMIEVLNGLRESSHGVHPFQGYKFTIAGRQGERQVQCGIASDRGHGDRGLAATTILSPVKIVRVVIYVPPSPQIGARRRCGDFSGVPGWEVYTDEANYMIC